MDGEEGAEDLDDFEYTFGFHFYLTSIKCLVHFDLTSMTPRFEFDAPAVPLRHHFDFTRLHFGLASMSLQIQSEVAFNPLRFQKGTSATRSATQGPTSAVRTMTKRIGIAHVLQNMIPILQNETMSAGPHPITTNDWAWFHAELRLIFSSINGMPLHPTNPSPTSTRPLHTTGTHHGFLHLSELYCNIPSRDANGLLSEDMAK